MRELPRLHPADRGAAAGQAASVLMVGLWSGWTTYGAAQEWAWLPGWSGPVVAALGGVGAMVTVLGGLVYARLAGQQDARRVLQDHRDAQARNRAEHGGLEAPARYPATLGGRHRQSAPGRRLGGWREPNDQAAIAGEGRRVLESASAHRFELPAGPQGAEATLARVLAAGVDLADGPGEDSWMDEEQHDTGPAMTFREAREAGVLSYPAPVVTDGDPAEGPAADPADPRWAPAVRRLVEVLAAEVRPTDGTLAGRGVSQVVAVVAVQVPELGAGEARAFVRDYMEVRAGYQPPSGRSWRDALAELPADALASLVVDLVAVKGRDGVTHEDLAERLDRLGMGGGRGLSLLRELVADGLLTDDGSRRYRYADQGGGAAG